MLTGFSRLTLSIVVIVVELTENTQYLLPIILVCMRFSHLISLILFLGGYGGKVEW